MAKTMYEATSFAAKSITATFDMVWALEAGLWNLRQSATTYFSNNPDATQTEATQALVNGLYIHGLNPRRIAFELTWDYEEQYVSELLLLNGMAIFDAWVDNFVDAAIIGKSNNQRSRIKDAVKKGNFADLDSALSAESTSILTGYFRYSAKRQDPYISNLCLIYKYFKSCRNCCAHNNRQFNSVAETNYDAIKDLTKVACGLNEFPKLAVTVKDQPVKLILRGVVGFYDVLIKIINHYDIVAADKVGIEAEVIRRWKSIPTIRLSTVENKRNKTIRQYMNNADICPCYSTKTNDFYAFLVSNNAFT